MNTAFVLITTNAGKEEQVFLKLKKRYEDIYPLFGEYDLIVKIHADDIGKEILTNIRSITGIIDTKTLVTVKM